MNEDDLWDMSDEALEAAFKEAQADQNSPDTDLEQEQEEVVADSTDTEEYDEEVTMDDDPSSDDVETEEFEDDSEEPDEGSDDETSNESETSDADEEDDSDAEDADPDEEADEADETSSDDADEDDDAEQPAQMYKFRANGKDYEFSSEEIVDQFPKIFGQAMDYTKKMQAIKPWRKTIDAVESAELTHEDVSLMIDVLKGDKGAMTEVLKRTGLEAHELDTEEAGEYVAKDYGRDESALAIKDIVNDIGSDPEYKTTHNILSKEWDEKSWGTITENPDMIRLLHEDVKSGMYAQLQPVAEKLKVYDNGRKSDLDYYKEAAQQHFAKTAEQESLSQRQAEKAEARKAEQAAQKKERERLAEVKAKSQKRDAAKKASTKRKAAAPPRGAASNSVVDYLDASDEAFDDWYKRVQEEM
ncbi:hypothetical protein AD45P2_00050 [Alteromonas phage vB_AmaP_AD45-P2]|uniref:Uncharacterized protein n=3 Tax=Pseudomonadota TaxID=1224 RepID=A0A922NY77_9HYPH|nr:cell envelope integrity protein TolA [Pseudorhizobium pelagicum]YP_008125982.1 tail length tape measure protein [Alteromonas phage vB_AmaP_AD45-P1]AGM46948.1 hypothetical protein AD45P3_00050 [Alteromonas phage vB_AmaP_AD45-P3]AGM47065.1 hypothetical protein AD45P4_00050 [Alteromonas phage vB_AmaP_AD45-P4]AGM47181.1 hypothetical protein AD45P2_00050 [Alteromonas phage vB_AmaP_AD45-P2]AGM46829.1 hypothetical protein AD45P1_00055 [Alteromonas phage vB_AmaP_AD45-P1]KEQ05580.1 hypothetical pro